MDDSKTPWQTAFDLMLKPRLLLQGVVEYLSAWVFTRRWLLWFFLLAPAWLLVAAALILIGLGYSISNNDLALRYADWIESEVPTANLESDSADDIESSETVGPEHSGAPDLKNDDSLTAEDGVGDVTQYGELLLRRLLQLKNSGSRITYIVALQQNRKGRVGQARQMMRRIAPEGGGGFGPAHTWLAIDIVRTGKTGTKELNDILEKDLESGSKWSQFPPTLAVVYARLLEGRQQIGPALSMLERASERDSRLAVPLADMARRHGRDQRMNRATGRVKDEIRAKMEANEETMEDLASLANIFLLEEEPERALQVIEIGLKKEPENATMKTLLSNAYLAQYLSKADFEKGEVNLGLLDAALKASPANPAVGREVARLMAVGQDAPPELKAALQGQLKDGSATAVTHLLLAVGLLSKNNLTEAIPHLRIANRQLPGSPMAMNNLALALARTDQSNLQEAQELSDAAVAISRSNPEYLDTQGEIRALAGDTLGAVESFEAAIGFDRTRRDTREKLAKAYRELGMEEMAKIQEAEIAELD